VEDHIDKFAVRAIWKHNLAVAIKEVKALKMADRKERDPAKTVEDYQQFIKSKQSEMEFLRKHFDQATDPKRKAGLIATFPQIANNIALALYSSGAEIAECKRWFGVAVDTRREWAELMGFEFEDYGLAFEDMETFSGALLIGRQAEVVELHRKARYQSNRTPSLINLIDQYCDVLMGTPISHTVDERSLKKVAPDWLTLPPLFQAVADRDQKLFAEGLEAYLVKSWERHAKEIKRAAKDQEPTYVGAWNLLSAALRQIMGNVPELSKKTRGYVPAELIEIK
jgi:hypothetical protein